ncbi:MAG: radical SAM protein, partial [Acidiferrobacterales bacterium]
MFAARPVSALDSRFVVSDFEPAYMRLYRSGELANRVEGALEELADCCACPRDCHVNRLENEKRVCNTGRYAIVSSAFAHFGEED